MLRVVWRWLVVALKLLQTNLTEKKGGGPRAAFMHLCMFLIENQATKTDRTVTTEINLGWNFNLQSHY